jgi:hypothetical protein
MEWLEVFLRIGSWFRHRWRSWRYGAKADLDVHWTTAPIYVHGVASKHWREIRVVITAPKHEEVVVSEGTVFARRNGERTWLPLYTLEEHGYMRLPLEVQANRQQSLRLSGKKTAARLRELFGGDVTAEIRVVLRDFHGSPVASRTIALKPGYLEQEEMRD